MTPTPRLARSLAALAVVALVAVPAATPVAAESLPDLYAAIAAGTGHVGVVDIDTANLRVAAGGFDATPAVSMLDFLGKQAIYAVGTPRQTLYHINVSAGTYETAGTLGEPVSDMAVPKGSAVYFAVPSKSGLWALNQGDAKPSSARTFPEAVNLLAANNQVSQFLAAVRGGTWAAVVNGDDRSFTRITGLTGTIVAAAVSADAKDPCAYIALREPNAVARVSLLKHTVTWTAPLSGVPLAVTASWSADLPGTALVTVGGTIYTAADGKATRWRDLPTTATANPVSQMLTSYNGSVLYLAVKDKVVAISVKDPFAKAPTTLDLGGTAADLAAWPDYSAATGGTGPDNGTDNGNGGSNSGNGGSASPGPTKPPTDTDPTTGHWRPDPGDPMPLVALFVGVALTVAVASSLAIRHWMRE